MMNYKIVLIGDGGVGKTAFLNQVITSEFERKYVPTLGTEVRVLKFETNYGPLCFNVWDCAGNEKFRGLGDGYYINADGAIVMFDQQSNMSLINTRTWCQKFFQIAECSNAILCGNKCDIMDPKVRVRDIAEISRTFGMKYIATSAKTGYACVDPFLELARKISGHTDLVFMIQREE